MPPRSRARESFCQRPSDNTHDAEADMNRHRTDQRRTNLDKIARYIIRPLSQSSDRHVGMDFLKRCGIKYYDMDFKTGQVGKRAEPYIQLVQPQVIEQWLREIGSPPLKDRRDFVNEFSREFGDSPLWEATFMWDCLYTYISEYENAQGNCVMTTRTTWLDVSCGSSRLINRLGEKNANWQLKALLRQHLPNPSRYDRIPDSQKPHVMCYLADEAQLVDDKLLTSELTALLVVAADTALKATWQKQKIIPVTLITGSRRTVRVSQCILNAETGGIEIRKSPLVSFPNGFRADWDKCLVLLGWILGTPVGRTM